MTRTPIEVPRKKSGIKYEKSNVVEEYIRVFGEEGASINQEVLV